MLERLGIEEDKIDDLVFEDEETAPKVGMKWLALAKVHTSNIFSPQTFEQHMKVAWCRGCNPGYPEVNGFMELLEEAALKYIKDK